MSTVKVAMIGVGNISGIYLKNFAETFKNVKLVAVCDLIRARAEKAQKAYKTSPGEGLRKSRCCLQPCSQETPAHR